MTIFNVQSEAGISPDSNVFPPSLSSVNWTRLPISGGMVPVRSLSFSTRETILFRLPICDGMFPLRLLLPSSIAITSFGDAHVTPKKSQYTCIIGLHLFVHAVYPRVLS